MLNRCKLIQLPEITDLRGSLSFLEKKHIGFDIKRVYFLYNVDQGTTRGAHAHKELHQFFLPINGSFSITLDDGTKTSTYHLNQRNIGLYVHPGLWRTIYNFKSLDSVCMVFASIEYDENDYIRNYDEYINYVKNLGKHKL